MAYQAIFKRYELKYMITKEQKEKIVKLIEPYMQIDKYGRVTIRNIYMDTDSYRLIRDSIEKPMYKEKLRIRSYKKVDNNEKVFVELKKKYKHVVYKRRVSVGEKDAVNWICNREKLENYEQIEKEIEYFLDYYKDLRPSVFLSYEREAYYSKDGSDFRITFDDNILVRQEDISLTSEIYGKSILDDDKVIMELKCSGGIPLWMVEILSKNKIYKTSYSKYGTAYKNIILPKIKEETKNV